MVGNSSNRWRVPARKARQHGKTDENVPLSNDVIAQHLLELGELLEAQHANPFRVRAYQQAAVTVGELNTSVHDILTEHGLGGLTRLPGIGFSLARAIEQLCHTGRLGLLDRLRGDISPEHVFGTVAGIGRELAARIHEQLGIESLAELEATAYDGRLATVPGMGSKRLRGVQESLAGRFRRRPHAPEANLERTKHPLQSVEYEWTLRNPQNVVPTVSELLDIDAEYRRKAATGDLKRIAPRRFNPLRAAWLPILHTVRGDRHYTALFSNTARAHEFGKTDDWVVIYRDDHDGDGQWTVITAHLGPMRGKRIVRGRESECLEHYSRKVSA